MIIIADSGSSKTDWIILDKDKKIEFKTKGINPFFLSNKDVIEDINRALPKELNVDLIQTVHFYGPACSTAERCAIVKSPLKSVFKNAEVNIESDLLASARALFQKERGIACILGTGSNSGLYDGKSIIDNITSTGYILGDEGSGANLGLELVKKYINHELGKDLEDKFFETYNLTPEQIIDKVYKGDYPNRFLASFSPFISENLTNASIKEIAEVSFSRFLDIHVLPYANAEK